MHSFGQDRNYAYIIVRVPAPIDEVVLVMAEVTLNAEFGGDRTRGRLMTHDTGEGIRQAGDVAITKVEDNDSSQP